MKNWKLKKPKKYNFIADGAQWIWNRVLPMLLNLGVKKQVITETVDYYHGIEHLSKIIEAMPSNLQKTARGQTLQKNLRNTYGMGKLTI